MTYVIRVPHLHRVGCHFLFDLTQDILYEMGIVWDSGLIKYLAQLRERDAAVNASLFLKEIMDHLKELMPEFDEFVRRVRHDE